MSTENTVNLESDSDDSKQRRERSTIEFPYSSLDDAIELTSNLHDFAGNSSCDINELAAHIGLKASGGGFRLKLSTARTFGLTQSEQRGTIQITELGNRIIDPQTEKQARVDSFLNVPLYKTIYESRKGHHLPNPAVLEREMVALGVAQKQKSKARQVFERSAKEAGFINQEERFTMPPLSQRAPLDVSGEQENHGGAGGRVHGSGSGGNGGGGLDPFIQGLLNSLPEPKSKWPLEKRAEWLTAAQTIFNLIYTDEGGGTIEIKVTTPKSNIAPPPPLS